VLVLWDSIFANSSKESLQMLSEKDYNSLSQENLFKIENDPIHFLEFLSISMLQYLRKSCIFLYFYKKSDGRE